MANFLAQFQSIKNTFDRIIISVEDVSDLWPNVKKEFGERLPFKRASLNNKTRNSVLVDELPVEYILTTDSRIRTRSPQEQSLFWFREPYATVVLVTCELQQVLLLMLHLLLLRLRKRRKLKIKRSLMSIADGLKQHAASGGRGGGGMNNNDIFSQNHLLPKSTIPFTEQKLLIEHTLLSSNRLKVLHVAVDLHFLRSGSGRS